MKQSLSGMLTFIILLSFSCPLSSEEIPLPENYTVEKAAYNIKVKDNLTEATLSFSLNIIIHSDQWCEVRLASTRHQVLLPRLPKQVILTKDNKHHKLIFRKAGTYRLTGTISLGVERENTIHKLTSPIVPATFGSAEIIIPATDLGLLIKPEAPWQKKEKGKVTIVTFSPAATDELTIVWGPKKVMAQRAEGISLDTTSFAVLENGLITTDAHLEFIITNQPLSKFSLLLPDKTVLLELKGKNLNRWFIDQTPEGNILNVFLQNAVDGGNYSLRLSLEAPLAINQPLRLRPIKELNIAQQRGVLLFTIAQGFNLKIEETKLLHQIDPRSYHRQANIAYRWENPSAHLVVSISPKEPRIYTQFEILHILKPYFIITKVKTIWKIKNTGINTVTLQIPANFSVISVDGPAVKTHHFKDNRLEVLFSKPLLGKADFTIELQSPYKPKEPLMLRPIIPDKAVGFETTLAIKPDNLESKIESSHRITQISPEQLSTWLKKYDPAFAFQSNQNNWRVEISSVLLKPQLNVTVYEYLYQTEDTLSRETNLRFSVRKAPLFSLDILVPDDFIPTEVKTAKLKTWDYDQRSHKLKIDFVEGIKDEHIIRISSSVQTKKAIDESKLSSFSILTPSRLGRDSAVAPLRKITTYLVVSARLGISLELTGSLDNIGELSIDKLPAEISRSVKPSALRLVLYSLTPDWSFYFTATPEPVQIEAVVATALTIRPGQLRSFNLIDYSVKELRKVNRFRIELPPGALNSEFRGEDIRSSEKQGNTWEIKLHRKVNSYRLTVIYEKALSGHKESAAFTPLRLIDATLNQGTIVIAPDNPRDEVSLVAKENAQASNASEIKISKDISDWLPTPPVHFIAYTSERARLKLKVKTHELNPTLQAKIYESNLYSRLHDNGELVTYFHMKIENKGKQNLTVRLPSETIFWGAFLNNKPVKPTRKQKGEMLVPLMTEQTTENQLLSLVIVYVQDIKKLTSLKTLSLTMPQTDLNINNAAWHLFLPSGHYLNSHSGNMELVLEDPLLVHPSLAGVVSGSGLSFLQKAWYTIPPVVKQAVLYLLIIIMIIIGLIFLVKILRVIIAYRRIAILRWAVRGTIVCVFVVGLAVLLMPRLVGTRKRALSVQFGITSGEREEEGYSYAPKKPKRFRIKGGLEVPESPLPKETSSDAWKNTEASDHKESIGDEERYKDELQFDLRTIELKNKELYKRAQKQLVIKGRLKELDEMTKRIEEYEVKSDKPLSGKGVYDQEDTDKKHKEESRITTDRRRKLSGGEKDKDKRGEAGAYKTYRRISKTEPAKSQPSPAEKPSAEPAKSQPIETEEPPEEPKPSPVQPDEKRLVNETKPVAGPSAGSISTVDIWQLKTPKSPQTFSRTKQGRTKGALAIPVSLPLHQTDYYRFQSNYLGKTVATISFTTLSTTMILFLQLLLCLGLAGGVCLLIHRYNPFSVIFGLVGIIILVFIIQFSTEGLVREFFRTAFWFSLVLTVLIGLVLRRKILSSLN